MSEEQQAQWEAEAEEEARAADEQGRAESELAAPAGSAWQQVNAIFEEAEKIEELIKLRMERPGETREAAHQWAVEQYRRYAAPRPPSVTSFVLSVCPECAMQPKPVINYERRHVHMECPKCHRCGPNAGTHFAAYERWNASVKPNPQP